MHALTSKRTCWPRFKACFRTLSHQTTHDRRDRTARHTVGWCCGPRQARYEWRGSRRESGPSGSASRGLDRQSCPQTGSASSSGLLTEPNVRQYWPIPGERPSFSDGSLQHDSGPLHGCVLVTGEIATQLKIFPALMRRCLETPWLSISRNS